MDRTAIDTIRGYCYQFDKTILELLCLKNSNDTVEVEGIEDIDVELNGELIAIQCKYYEKTEYNHSVIAKPIRLMLEHYSKNKKFNGKYHLFGHYKSGHEKLSIPFNVEFLKDNFLTYHKAKLKHETHEKLGLSEDDLEGFLQRLIIDINADNFEKQQENVVHKLMKVFSCNLEEARHYYYNSAFDLVIKLGCNSKNREISRSVFLTKINRSQSLFNIWMYKYKGRKAYLKKLHVDLFPRTLNTEAYDRFFIIDISTAESLEDVKECVYIIQKKWSNLSNRSSNPYSPFIYLFGSDDSTIKSIKTDLYNEGLIFVDGYNYRGSKFCVKTILSAKESKNIKFQFFETLDDTRLTINTSSSRKEVYQFICVEKKDEFYDFEVEKTIKIQVKNFNDIKEIV